LPMLPPLERLAVLFCLAEMYIQCPPGRGATP
jgi:hypothetical protein